MSIVRVLGDGRHIFGVADRCSTEAALSIGLEGSQEHALRGHVLGQGSTP